MKTIWMYQPNLDILVYLLVSSSYDYFYLLHILVYLNKNLISFLSYFFFFFGKTNATLQNSSELLKIGLKSSNF